MNKYLEIYEQEELAMADAAEQERRTVVAVLEEGYAHERRDYEICTGHAIGPENPDFGLLYDDSALYLYGVQDAMYLGPALFVALNIGMDEFRQYLEDDEATGIADRYYTAVEEWRNYVLK